MQSKVIELFTISLLHILLNILFLLTVILTDVGSGISMIISLDNHEREIIKVDVLSDH